MDGKPVSKAELDKQDRERQREVMDAVARREHESPRDREKRLARREQARREEQQVIDELFQIYTFTIVGRQSVDGHPAIAVDFVPKANIAPKTDEGKLMKKIKGRVWVSEDDYQVARVQAEMLDDISVLGFLGKLYKGTTASFERRKINNEIWLPAEARFDGIRPRVHPEIPGRLGRSVLRLSQVLGRDRHHLRAPRDVDPAVERIAKCSADLKVRRVWQA